MRVVFLILAIAGAVGLAFFVAIYPLGKIAAVAWVIAFVVALLSHRLAWLLLLPGLMPVIDLTLWTGGFYLAESDALVLSALAACGLRGALLPGQCSEEPSGWRFGGLSWLLLILMLTSYLLSTHWGAISGFLSQPELRVGYFSEINGVRLIKGMLWAVLLLPFSADAFRRHPTQAGQALVWGILLGLVLVALATVWERYLFTGLSDFASDYRTTALFWEMNVGGATLDGWLALSVPFALWFVLQPASPKRMGVLLAALVLAGYACFTTFSRGLYAGLTLGCAVTVMFWARTGLRHGLMQFALGSVLAWACYATLLGGVLILVFRTGGYRGLIAMLGLAAVVFAVAPVAVGQPGRVWAGALMLALTAFIASVLAMFLLPKGAYLAYATSAVAVGALLIRKRERDGDPLQTDVLLLAAFGWLAGNAILVTTWWSEGSGLGAGILAMLILLAPFAKVVAHPHRVWKVTVQSGVGVVLVLGVLAVGVVASSTYYASKRFETVDQDIKGRFQHWAAGASLPNGAKERWFGIGVGQFAERYFWQTPEGMFPGTHQLLSDDGMIRFLRLVGPQHALGFGEIYRVSQRVSSALKPSLFISIDARAPEGQPAELHFEVCRKHLLYADECLTKNVQTRSATWEHLEVILDGEALGSRSWPPKPTVFSLGVANEGGVIDIDNLSVTDARGIDLFDNGNFSAGGDFWFFSSDRFHLPWHAKNLWLHLWVEQGWFGVVVFTLLGLVALWRVSVGRAAHHPLAPALAGALLAFFGVGAFDSLIDAPRLTTFAFMLMLLALGLQMSSQVKIPRKEKPSTS
jgi:O-antigen ligase